MQRVLLMFCVQCVGFAIHFSTPTSQLWLIFRSCRYVSALNIRPLYERTNHPCYKQGNYQPNPPATFEQFFLLSYIYQSPPCRVFSYMARNKIELEFDNLISFSIHFINGVNLTGSLIKYINTSYINNSQIDLASINVSHIFLIFELS